MAQKGSDYICTSYSIPSTLEAQVLRYAQKASSTYECV